MSSKHIRYTRLEQVCERALLKVLAQLENWNQLSHCYPTYSIRYEQHLRKVQTEIVTLWKTLCENEFQEIFQERGMHKKLDELDDLIYIAKRRKHEYLVVKGKDFDDKNNEYYDGENNNNNHGESHNLEEQRMSLEKSFPKMETFTPEDIVNFHKVSMQRKFAADLEKRLESLKNVNTALEKEIDTIYANINNDLDTLNSTIYSENLGNTSSMETINSLRSKLLVQLQALKE